MRVCPIMKEARVRPEVVDSSVHTQFLVAAKQSTMVRSEAPSKPWIELNPFCSNLSVFDHLFHKFDGELGLVINFEDAHECVCATELCSHWSATLLGFFAEDEFDKLWDRAVGIVHGLFENWHAAAEERAVVFLGGLRKLKRVLELGGFVDLL